MPYVVLLVGLLLTVAVFGCGAPDPKYSTSAIEQRVARACAPSHIKQFELTRYNHYVLFCTDGRIVKLDWDGTPED